MPLEILTIPCRTYNYAFIAHDDTSGETAVIDLPEAGGGYTVHQVAR